MRLHANTDTGWWVSYVIGPVKLSKQLLLITLPVALPLAFKGWVWTWLQTENVMWVVCWKNSHFPLLPYVHTQLFTLMLLPPDVWELPPTEHSP